MEIAWELEGINLGDERLNKRSRKMIESFSADPQASCNAACSGWSETVGAYRFLDNPSVTPEKILKPHIEKTKERIKEHPVVLIAQDTTELDYSKHPPKDSRCLNTEDRRGLYDHTHVALTPNGLNLGVVGVEYFDRDPEELGQSKERSKLPIEEKESHRWLEGYRLASKIACDCPQTQVVSVADREADLYDIFLEADKQAALNTHFADFVIRAKINRSLLERDPEAGPHAYKKVRDQVSQSELRSTQILNLPATPKRAARQAKLEIRAIRVTVKPPHTRSSSPVVSYNVVLVEEIDGPNDGTDVCWLLITSLPIDTLEEIQLVIDYYVGRWPIEVFFRVFKTGCKVEEIQLETLSRLKNCLAFYKIIAWRVMYVTHLNRESPSLPCSILFEDYEWKPVWSVVTKKPLPKTTPTLAQFMPLLTQLGGYNNRATEPPPGPQVMWVAIRRMTDLAIAWLTFGPGGKINCV